MKQNNQNIQLLTADELQEGRQYKDNALGIIWDAIEKIESGMMLQVARPGGGVIIATPETCVMKFIEFTEINKD